MLVGIEDLARASQRDFPWNVRHGFAPRVTDGLENGASTAPLKVRKGACSP